MRLGSHTAAPQSEGISASWKRDSEMITDKAAAHDSPAGAHLLSD